MMIWIIQLLNQIHFFREDHQWCWFLRHACTIIYLAADMKTKKYSCCNKHRKNTSLTVWPLLMSLVAHLFGRVEYQVHCLPCCFNTILSLFRDTESMFEVMAVSIENLLCSSATGPQSRYNRVPHLNFQHGFSILDYCISLNNVRGH